MHRRNASTRWRCGHVHREGSLFQCFASSGLDEYEHTFRILPHGGATLVGSRGDLSIFSLEGPMWLFKCSPPSPSIFW